MAQSPNKPTHSAVAKTGTYTGRDGNSRNSYLPIGAAWSDEGGSVERIKIDNLPISWDGMIYLRPRDAAGDQQ